MKKINNGKINENFKQMTDEEQLKVLLAGYSRCSIWFGCDYSCSAYIPDDKEFLPVFELMEKYNLSVKDYMNLYVTYWKKCIHSYEHEYGNFIKDLEPTFLKFRVSEDERPRRRYSKLGCFSVNDNIGEKQLAKLINSNSEVVGGFINKYNLSELDFIVLSKTELHNAFYHQKLIGYSDSLIPNLGKTLETGLGHEEVEKIKSLFPKK